MEGVAVELPTANFAAVPSSSSTASSSSSPPPILSKTYDMVVDPATDSIVSWSTGGISFVVWNVPELARDVLPKYFKHNNFSSYVRQLNTYSWFSVFHSKNMNILYMSLGHFHLPLLLDAGASEVSPKAPTRGDGPCTRTQSKRMQEELENLASLHVSREPTLVEDFTEPMLRTLVTFRAKPCEGEAKPCDEGGRRATELPSGGVHGLVHGLSQTVHPIRTQYLLSDRVHGL